MSPGRMHRVILRLRDVVQRADGAEASDAELLRSFIDARDHDAFAALVRRHAGLVLGVCRRVTGDAHDAEDAFQAVFCVLLRKAASIRRREVLGSWLYGVAFRTSLAAKARRAKTRRREQQVDPMPQPLSNPPDLDQDWQPLLDAALLALPEMYRTPIVLCDLEGKSRRQAAQQLCVAEGTLSSRLARGRRLLAGRLRRQGVVLSGGALAALLAEQAAASVVSATLIHGVVAAGASMIVGAVPAASAVSQAVHALTEGVIKAMLIAKLKSCALLLVACAALTVAGLWLTGSGAAQTPSASDPPETRNPAALPVSQLPGSWSGPHALQNCASCHQDPHQSVQVNPHVKPGQPQFRIEAVLTITDETGKPKTLATPTALIPLGQRMAFSTDAAFVLDGKPRTAKFSWNIDLVRQRGGEVLVSLTIDKRVRQTNSIVVGFSNEFEDYVPLNEWKVVTDPTWHISEFKIKVSPGAASTLPAVGAVPRPLGELTQKKIDLSALERNLAKSLGLPAASPPPSSALSPDGARLAVGGKEDVLIIDVRTGKLLSRSTVDAAISSLAFSPDGKLIASGSPKGTVHLWDAVTGKEIRRMVNNQPVVRIEFTVDANTKMTLLIVRTTEPEVRIWDLETGKMRQRGGPNAPPGGDAKPKQPSPMPKQIEGKIEKIHADDPRLVQISVGSDQGLMKNDTLEVYRLTPPIYLGQVRISDVQPHHAFGRILSAGAKELPREGDRVTSSLNRKP